MEQMQQFESPSNEWAGLSDRSVIEWLKEACGSGQGSNRYQALRATEIGRRLASPSTEREIELRLDQAVDAGLVERTPDGDIPLYRPRV